MVIAGWVVGRVAVARADLMLIRAEDIHPVPAIGRLIHPNCDNGSRVVDAGGDTFARPLPLWIAPGQALSQRAPIGRYV